MNDLISLVIVDQEPRVDSRLIAKHLGVKSINTRELIEQYLSDFEEFGITRFETELSGKVGQPQKYYLLNEDQSYLLLTYSQNTTQASELKKRLVHSFSEYRRGFIPSIRKTGSYALPTTSPSTTDPRIIETAFSSWLNIAKLCGFEGNMAVLSADRGTQAITGVSPLTLMGATHLIADQRGKVYTPTELGQCLTPPISARKVNVLLESAGLQQRESGAWLPTSDAQGLFEWADTGTRYSNGTPVKQLRWFKSVLDFVPLPLGALTASASLISTHAIGGAQ